MQVNDKEIFFAKICKNAIIPSKDEENGGYDVYCSPECKFPIVIKPREIAMIKTGIASAFSSKYVALLEERGSTGSRGMALRCGVIDSGYRGEWNVPLNNTTEKTIVITDTYPVNSLDVTVNNHEPVFQKLEKIIELGNTIYYPASKAIAQFLLIEVPVVKCQEIDFNELKVIESKRGVGMLGSSGK